MISRSQIFHQQGDYYQSSRQNGTSGVDHTYFNGLGGTSIFLISSGVSKTISRFSTCIEISSSPGTGGLSGAKFVAVLTRFRGLVEL
jgi:hypothetical protein